METQATPPSPPPTVENFEITDSAARRIATLIHGENDPEAKFRISVLGGGCSGFQYHFDLDHKPLAENDLRFNKDTAVVVIDDVSFGLLGGSVLDYVETLGSAGFEIKNPNSTARCGCGNSFSV